MKIALDSMGGDKAPKNIIAGAVMALKEKSAISKLYLVGDESAVRGELKTHGFEDPRIEIVHASQVVLMSDHAVEAVRRKKDSSISRATDLVKEGKADALVSAGNTGALVAASTIKLRTLPGIDRAGLAVILPGDPRGFVLIDAGANVDAIPKHVVGYAIMGSIYAREVLGCENPRVGLMSVGTEPGKGNEFTKECYKVLSTAPINFVGNVEGHGLYSESVDVVVCDGFIGNIILKTAENLSKTLVSWITKEIKSSPVRIVGGLLAKGAFQAVRKKTSADVYGGTPLLGVNGICIKAHGNASPLAVKNALRAACRCVEHQVNPSIVETIQKFNEKSSAAAIIAP